MDMVIRLSTCNEKDMKIIIIKLGLEDDCMDKTFHFKSIFFSEIKLTYIAVLNKLTFRNEIRNSLNLLTTRLIMCAENS